MRVSSVAFLVLSVLVSASCQRQADLAQQAAGMAAVNPPPHASGRALGIHVEPCDIGKPLGAGEVEGETYFCGVYTVPQHWNEPDGARIDLGFVVAKATGESPEPDPLVFLAGGPGQSAVATALTAYQELRPTRDIVRMDQRGAGTSQRLGIEECLVLALQDDSAEADVEKLLRAMAAADRDDDAAADAAPAASASDVKATVDRICWNQFTAQGLDLDTFNTSQSARDVIEFVRALDYESFNLHGISYGTRLAMTIMRELDAVDGAPELRAVVLDSPFPPSMLLLSNISRNYHDPVIRLFAECRADPACAAAYPDLETRFKALLERLEAEPMTSADGSIGRGELLRTILDLRGTRAGYMPRMIAELERGDTRTYLALKRRELGTEPAEGIDDMQTDDPVQAYMAAAMTVLGAGGEISEGIRFVAGFTEAVRQAEPLLAIERFIRAEFAGDQRDRLLQLTAGLDRSDIDASPLVADLRAAEQAASPPSAEEQAAQKARAERLLAIIEVASFLNKNIHCAEDLKFETLDDALAVIDTLEIPALADRDIVVEQAARCAAWPVAAQPRSVADPVSSDVPTLILQGTYDVRTPLLMGREASRQLARSTLAIVPQQGHEVWVDATSCPAKLASAFIIDPERRPDLSCLDARKPRWALPEGQ